jgi:hypothetical protein
MFKVGDRVRVKSMFDEVPKVPVYGTIIELIRASSSDEVEYRVEFDKPVSTDVFLDLTNLRFEAYEIEHVVKMKCVVKKGYIVWERV